MWSPHVESTCGLPHTMSCVHMWSPHMIWNMYRMWFTVCDLPYVESTCGFLWNHIQTSNHIRKTTCGFPYMISVCGVRMWSSYVESTCGLARWSYTVVYDHIRKPHVELTSVCGVHMWEYPYVESTCGPFFPCDGDYSLGSKWKGETIKIHK